MPSNMINADRMVAIFAAVDGATALPDLATVALLAHRACGESCKTTLALARAAGIALLKAKEALPHGGWLPWLRDCCPIPERTAQLYMRIADGWEHLEKSATVADLTLRGADRLLAQSAKTLIPPAGKRLLYGDDFPWREDEPEADWGLIEESVEHPGYFHIMVARGSALGWTRHPIRPIPDYPEAMGEQLRSLATDARNLPVEDLLDPANWRVAPGDGASLFACVLAALPPEEAAAAVQGEGR